MDQTREWLNKAIILLTLAGCVFSAGFGFLLSAVLRTGGTQ
jgi:hypothetical protein